MYSVLYVIDVVCPKFNPKTSKETSPFLVDASMYVYTILYILVVSIYAWVGDGVHEGYVEVGGCPVSTWGGR